MKTSDYRSQSASSACEADTCYRLRKQKAAHVWQTYESMLRGRTILDVGADECHLKEHMDSEARYLGVGRGGRPDLEIDLESGSLPFEDGEFETVLCLDVLEHLENVHHVFDELCRVSSEYVIVSLPNCLGHLWRILTRFGGETPDGLMKFYGLPPEPPQDRHRWFFDAIEAEKFVRHRGAKNGMNVVRIDFRRATTRPTKKRRLLLYLARRILLRRDIDRDRLDRGTLWAVLKRQDAHE